MDNTWMSKLKTLRNGSGALYLQAVICLVLVAAIFGVYGQVRHFDFVNYDDPKYVYDNYYVPRGLTSETVRWALTAVHEATWQPMVWLSYMLEQELHGMDPGWYHLTNVLLHTANTLLLFLLLRSMTGALWQSSLVAALFALHPIHVESVAWITERKDVLSTLFFMLTLLSYARWVKSTGRRFYALTLFFFILGLMSKPMLVTLPFVLLLLDFWPLKRFKIQDSGFKISSIILEKFPFFILTVASCVLTYYVQQKGGAIAPADEYPVGVRIANALVSYTLYMKKLLLPFDLAVLYPHPGKLSFWKPTAASVLLILLSFPAAGAIKKRPYLLMGWLWFLGTMVPVIGIIQIGAHALADRFAYIPFIGLYIILAWGISDIASHLTSYKKTTVSLSAIGLLMMMLLTRTTAGYWKDSITLFEHALKVNPENFVAHNCLGCALADQGRTDEALQHYTESLRIEPLYAEAHANIGIALAKKGMLDKAIRHYTAALEIDPGKPGPRNNLGAALNRAGRTDEAIEQFRAVLQIDPEYVSAHYNLGIAYAKKGRFADAVKHFSEVFRLRPEYALPGKAAVFPDRLNDPAGDIQAAQVRAEYGKAQNNLGAQRAMQGNVAEAIENFNEALKVNPDAVETHYNLGLFLQQLGRFDDAAAHYREALRIKPDYIQGHAGLAALLMHRKNIDGAASHYQEALRLDPGNPEYANSLGIALARLGKKAEAIESFRRALTLDPDYADAQHNLVRMLERK